MTAQLNRAVLHDSCAVSCDHCGQSFTPRITHGPNRGRFCSQTCKNAWHNARRSTNPISLGEEFRLSLFHVKPRATQRKGAMHYLVTVELSKEQWDILSEADLARKTIQAVCKVGS